MSNDIIVNEGVIRLMNKLFIKSKAKKAEISDLFENPLIDRINKSKKFDTKHTKFNVDEYNLLIRENMYNNPKSIYGWVLCDGKPVNIHVTEELKLTTSKEKIFDLLLTDFVHRNKITLTKNSTPGAIYKALNIDVSKYLGKE